MFSNRKLKADYMSFKQVETWFPTLLKRELGFDYTVSVDPVLFTNVIGLTINTKGVSAEGIKALSDYFGCTSFVNLDNDKIGKVIEISKKHYKRKYRNEYEFIVTDYTGFYIVRKRIERVKELSKT